MEMAGQWVVPGGGSARLTLVLFMLLAIPASRLVWRACRVTVPGNWWPQVAFVVLVVAISCCGIINVRYWPYVPQPSQPQEQLAETGRRALVLAGVAFTAALLLKLSGARLLTRGVTQLDRAAGFMLLSLGLTGWGVWQRAFVVHRTLIDGPPVNDEWVWVAHLLPAGFGLGCMVLAMFTYRRYLQEMALPFDWRILAPWWMKLLGLARHPQQLPPDVPGDEEND